MPGLAGSTVLLLPAPMIHLQNAISFLPAKGLIPSIFKPPKFVI
jgi:hypothetical protein